MLWGNLKAGELAGLCVDTISELESAALGGIARVQNESQLVLSFLRHTSLSL
jgi:putative transposase